MLDQIRLKPLPGPGTRPDDKSVASILSSSGRRPGPSSQDWVWLQKALDPDTPFPMNWAPIFIGVTVANRRRRWSEYARAQSRQIASSKVSCDKSPGQQSGAAASRTEPKPHPGPLKYVTGSCPCQPRSNHSAGSMGRRNASSACDPPDRLRGHR